MLSIIRKLYLIVGLMGIYISAMGLLVQIGVISNTMEMNTDLICTIFLFMVFTISLFFIFVGIKFGGKQK